MLRSHRYVLITGLVGLLAVAALLVLYRHVAFTSLVAHEERSNAALTQVFANSVWPGYADFTAEAGHLGPAVLAQRSEIERLRRDVIRLIQGSRVVKVKLYDLHGLTVFSTDPRQIGQDKRDNEGFRSARADEPASNVTFRDSFDSFEGVLVDRNVVSSYIPIHEAGTRRVVAVFEVYSDVTDLVAGIEATQTRITAGVIITLSAMYLLVLAVVRRADRVIAHQEAQRREDRARIRYQAYHDALTGLPNRTGFTERLGEAVERAAIAGHEVGVLFLDLDRFKRINDSLGHGAGDEVLRAAASRIAGAVRESDSVYRMGGDEFTVILDPAPGPDQLAALAERLGERLGAPMTAAGQSVIVTASSGIAVYPHDADRPEVLVKNADAAMYRAKESGRNRACFYSSDLTEQALDQLRLETLLRQGVRDGAFELHYQPRVTPSGQVIGAEALLRWQHPTQGLLPPACFLPALEHNGLMDEVGAWVLREACRQAKRWCSDGGAPVRVSVNISGQQFRSGRLADTVRAALAEADLAPGLLELELTESILIDATDAAATTLDGLAALGVAIAVDDFGTGYSCLNYLKHLPIHYLKVDRTFVHGLRDDPRDAAIVGTIAALAHSLGLGLVAEGVETRADARALERFECRELQGWLFGRPVPAARFDALHRRPVVVPMAAARGA